jgi:acetyltransferase-like isoleucine patch superfamily enzyme
LLNLLGAFRGDLLSMLEANFQDPMSRLMGKAYSYILPLSGSHIDSSVELKVHPMARFWLETGATIVSKKGILEIGLDMTPSIHAQGNRHSGLTIRKDSQLSLHGHVRILRGAEVFLGPNSSLSIGDGTFLSNRTTVFVRKNIEIGSHCAISWNVTIMDCQGHSLRDSKKRKPVKIGNKVWLGCNSTVLPGVELGDGCVVGANSIVTKSFPENCLIAGSPAKILEKGIKWEI